MGFQELPLILAEKYLKPHLTRMGYINFLGSLLDGPSYDGVGLAVPFVQVVLEHKFVPFKNSQQGRGFLLHVRTPTFLFATTHLESWCGPE